MSHDCHNFVLHSCSLVPLHKRHCFQKQIGDHVKNQNFQGTWYMHTVLQVILKSTCADLEHMKIKNVYSASYDILINTKCLVVSVLQVQTWQVFWPWRYEKRTRLSLWGRGGTVPLHCFQRESRLVTPAYKVLVALAMAFSGLVLMFKFSDCSSGSGHWGSLRNNVVCYTFLKPYINIFDRILSPNSREPG